MAHEQQSRITDLISHGGSIIEGSHNVFVNALNIARVGDLCICSIHGLVSIATGSCKRHANGIPVARRNVDVTTCGALIITGSPNDYTESVTICS